VREERVMDRLVGGRCVVLLEGDGGGGGGGGGREAGEWNPIVSDLRWMRVDKVVTRLSGEK